jgi:hypothetical protein
MEIITQPDCGNSPKLKLIRDLTILFASYEVERVKDYFAEDIKWCLVGDVPIKGKDRFIEALYEMSENKAVMLTIHQILNHGKSGAVHGEMRMRDGKTYGFADFYEFASAGSEKIKAIVSYVISK